MCIYYISTKIDNRLRHRLNDEFRMNSSRIGLPGALSIHDTHIFSINIKDETFFPCIHGLLNSTRIDVSSVRL